MDEPAVVKIDSLMTVSQVAERLCVSNRTVWRLVATGQFPQPKRYNRKLVRWLTSDIKKYFESL